MARVLLLSLVVGAAAASFTAVGINCRPTALVTRVPPVQASAKIIPFAYGGLGATLLSQATGTTGASRVVLACAGLLSGFNLATIDNQRYAGAKRAAALVSGIPKGQQGLAGKWYSLVRLHLLGQVLSLVWMARATQAAGVLRAGASFMAANLLFFVGGAAQAKHDPEGRPAPIKPGLAKFVLTTDAVLMGAALLGSLSGAGSIGRAVGSYTFAAGCLIGAVEGAPKTAAALQKLMA